MKRKIGIVGGSFNPIHIRHMEIGMAALKEKKLDQLIFLPTGNPPHKKEGLADAEHRYRMTQLSVSGLSGASVSHLELERKGLIYTADTLKLLRDQFPDSNFYYIIGEDTLYDLPNWHTPDAVFKLCRFIVCCRSSSSIRKTEFVKSLEERGARFSYLSLPPVPISSTSIREELEKGMFPKTIMPQVDEYIRIFGLYGTKASPADFGISYGKLSATLTEKRFLHSLLVSYTARRLAKLHGVDVEKAVTAALLHDCAKCLPLSRMREIVLTAGMEPEEKTLSNGNLLHGPVGSILAQTEYGVRDAEILDAIRYHTTGHPGMTPLEMIVFLSDKIEPSRKSYAQLEKLRQEACRDLAAAMKLSLGSSKAYVQSKSESFHSLSLDTLDWLEKQSQIKE